MGFTLDERVRKAIASLIWFRYGAALFALVQILTYYMPYPAHYQLTALCGLGALICINVAMHLMLRGERMSPKFAAYLGLAVDCSFAMLLVIVYTFDVNTAIFIVLYLLPLEAALVFGPRMAFAVAVSIACAYTAREVWGSAHWDGYRGQEYDFLPVSVSFRMGIVLMIALVGSIMASSFARERQTSRKLVQVERERALAADRLAALKLNFVTAVSHELRTPLTSVIGFADTLRQRLVGADQQDQDLLMHLHEQALRLGDLVEQLTDVERLGGDNLVVARQPVAVHRLLHDACTAAGGTQAALSYPADMTRIQLQAVQHLQVAGDEAYLQRAVQALLDNALKYSDGAILVTAEQRDNEGRAGVSIVVTDNGPGIAPEHREHIFGAFERARVQLPASPGTGVGLTIAQHIAARHDGSLNCTDRSDGYSGSVFTLWLPQAL